MSRATACTVSLSNRSARSRLATSLAPTTSWWWKLTPPPGSNRRVAGLPMSCSSAASRSTRSGPGTGPSRPGLQVDRLGQHGQRVLVDVLVPVVLVDLQAQGRELGQHVVGQAGVHQHLEPGTRVGREQQLGQLVADPLGGHDLDPLGHLADRRADVGVQPDPELGGEPRGPHHPQRVVVEGLLGAHRGAQDARGEVGQAAERVDERQRGHPHRERVDREVPARQVALERVAERDHRLARVAGRTRRCGRWSPRRPGPGGPGDPASPAGRTGGPRSCRTPCRCPSARRPTRRAAARSRPGWRTSRSPGRRSTRPRKASRTGPPTRASSCPADSNSRAELERLGGERGQHVGRPALQREQLGRRDGGGPGI